MKATVLTLVLLQAGCSKLPEVVEPAATAITDNVTHIFISNHGWHTGVIIELSELTEVIPELAVRFAGNDYLEVGWGDNGFYQAKDITFGLVMQALLWPTDAVVHVVGFSGSPENYFSASKLTAIKVNKDNVHTLVRFIHNSFSSAATGAPDTMQQGIYGDSQFYNGTGSYYLFNTCNTWTAKALYSAGIDINPAFTLTASGITGFLSELEQ